MAIIVEDGSIVQNANSYVSRAEYIAHAAARGVTVADTDAADPELIQAAAFIDAHEGNLLGARFSREQAMSYPRTDLVISGFEWEETEIPRTVKLCQMAIALDIRAGVDPFNPQPELLQKRARVEGAVEVEFFGDDSAARMRRGSLANALLHDLLRNHGFGFQAVRS